MRTVKKILSTLSPLHTFVMVGLLLTSHSAMANSRLSDIFGNLGDEAKAIAPLFLLLVACIGVCIAAWAVISGILAKRQNNPLTWQVGGVIGGVLAVIIPLVIFAAAGSLSGGESEAGNVLRDLNVNY